MRINNNLSRLKIRDFSPRQQSRDFPFRLKLPNYPSRLKLRNYRLKLFMESLVIATAAVLLMVILLSS